MAPYEKLHAWRECHELALAVYRATKSFPTEEQFGLTSQIRRAAFSSAVNIVEGSARRSRKEFRRFLDISLSSLTEVGYALRFSRKLACYPTRIGRLSTTASAVPGFSRGSFTGPSPGSHLHHPPPNLHHPPRNLPQPPPRHRFVPMSEQLPRLGGLSEPEK